MNYDLSGITLPHALGRMFFKKKLKKNELNKTFLDNYSDNEAIDCVYSATLHKTNYADERFNGSVGILVPFCKTTTNYIKFISLFLSKYKPNDYSRNAGYFDVIDKYGFEIGLPGHPKLIPFGTDEIFIGNFNEYTISFAPYKDGVMLVDIVIEKSKRNKGIGTDIMNKIYDISEDNNIPIYLIPYPGEKFPSKEELNLIERLKKWYTNIGFGDKNYDNKVWCNFE